MNVAELARDFLAVLEHDVRCTTSGHAPLLSLFFLFDSFRWFEQKLHSQVDFKTHLMRNPVANEIGKDITDAQFAHFDIIWCLVLVLTFARVTLSG